MRNILFSLFFLVSAFQAGAQSLSDSVEFRRAFLKVFNARMKKFQAIAPESSARPLKVVLPGHAYCTLDKLFGGDIDDSSYVYEAEYNHEDQAEAAQAFRELLQLIRLSMKPYVLKEKEEPKGNNKLVYFFQTEKDFYYDSYLEAELRVDAKSNEYDVYLRVYARDIREVYYTDKGPQDSDEAYRRLIRKAALSSWAEFSQLKGRKLADGWIAKDSIPGYRGEITEEGGYTIFECYSTFQAPDDKQALSFFDKLMLKVKSAFPPGYAYYKNPEPPSEQVLKMYIFHKAYEEVNTLPSYPPLSYLLFKDPDRPGSYFLSLQVNRYK